MSKRSEIEKATKAVVEAEKNLQTATYHLNTEERELEILLLVELELTDNIKVLASQKIVTLAKGFQKAKSDLAKTKKSIEIAMFQVHRYQKIHSNAQVILQKCKETYDIISSRSDDNVVVSMFGRKINGQR